MPHHLSLLVHLVWSTRDRMPWIEADIRPRMHAYLGGILDRIGVTPLCIGGVADHVHLYVSLPSTVTISEVVGRVKANSSAWVHATFPKLAAFAWQKSYAALTVSASGDEAVRRYILGQEEHHRTVSFQEEYLAFLRKHNVPYDKRYVFE